MLSKQEIIEKITKSKEMVEAGNFKDAESEINCVAKHIFTNKFYSILGKFYHIRSLIDENKKDYSCMIFDQLVCMSPHFKYAEREEIEKKMKDFIEKYQENSSDDIIITIPSEFVHYMPFALSVNYMNKEIKSGSEVELRVHFESYFSTPVKIDSITMTMSHENGEELINTVDSFVINPNTIKNFHQKGKVPNAVRTQIVKTVSIRMGKLVLNIEGQFSEQLSIVPDTSSCNISIEMPPRCLICVKLPVIINITAVTEQLENLQISFQHECQFQLEYQGDCGPFTIEKGETKTTKFTFITSAPVFTVVNLTATFSTKTSGLIAVKKSLMFDFVAPFSVTAHILNSNFEEIRSSSIFAEEDYKLETTLLNVLDCPITLERISLKKDDSRYKEQIDKESLPLVLEQGEQYTFIAKQKTGICNLSIHFKCASEEIHYFLKMHPFSSVSRNAKYDFRYPPISKVMSVMNCVLVIDRSCSKEPELLTLNIKVESKKQFLENGPQSITFNAWSNKTAEIPIDLIPIEAGSFILPTISIDDGSGSIYSIHKPVVIRY